MAPAVAVLTIEAQLMMLTQRPVVDTSVVVAAVFSGERLAYGGGRHGFGGVGGGGGWPNVEKTNAGGRRKIKLRTRFIRDLSIISQELWDNDSPRSLSHA
eukprot:scaffold81221_cov60-Cyclotella_meneghiniana.AAC.1